jgi:hypothetical protein
MKSFKEYLIENRYSSAGNGPAGFTKIGTNVIIHTTHKDKGKTGVVTKIEELPSGKVYYVKYDGTGEVVRHYREDIPGVLKSIDKKINSDDKTDVNELEKDIKSLAKKIQEY